MRIGFPLAVSLVSFVALSPASMAIDFGDLLRNYLGNANPSQAAASQDVIKSNMNTRQAQLESEISAGVASGQITPQEETDLRADLNRIASLQGSYLADATLTNMEVQSMLNELTNFSARLNAYMTNTTANANSSYRGNQWFRDYFRRGQSGDYASNQSIMQSNIDARQAQIDSSIMTALQTGRLNWNDGQNFRNELNRIANSENLALADGRLDYSESRQILTDLDNLNTNMTNRINAGNSRNQYRHGRRGGNSVNFNQSMLSQRIQRGRSDGRLTPREYDQLMRDDQRIKDIEAQMRASGGRITFDEQRNLINQINQLNRKVTSMLDNKQVY